MDTKNSAALLEILKSKIEQWTGDKYPCLVCK